MLVSPPGTMLKDTRIYSLPRWPITRWLVDAGPDVPPDIRLALIASLFASIPVFAGGIINTVLVAAVIAARLPRAPFIIWFLLEIVVCAARVIVLVASRRAAAAGKPTPTDAYVLLGLCWAFSVGYGAFISLVSGDWVAATLACVSSAAMVGGTCFRNFGAPRMSAAMIVLSLGPVALGAIFTGEPIIWLTVIQTPLYLVAMNMAGYRLNANLVATMRAEQENERRAHHDALTGLLNRVGLANAIEAKWSARRQQELALFYLDLDGFKAVNDTLGHALGDRLLQKVAERLQGLIRAGDLAARIGGDEFVVLSEMSDRSKILCFGEELIEKLAAPYEVAEEMSTVISASIGVALAPGHGRDLTNLLAAADVALYDAKARGKSRCSIADSLPKGKGFKSA
jgi:diguanylate cyclase (GGDEF)-like protein